MRFLLAVVAAALVGGHASLAAAQVIPEEFHKARAARTQAINENNRAMFERYTMEDFILIEPTGHIEGREARAARMTPDAPRVSGPAPPRMNQRISIFNGDTIVVAWDQERLGVRMHFFEAWVKDGDTWRAAGAHVARSPQ